MTATAKTAAKTTTSHKTTAKTAASRKTAASTAESKVKRSQVPDPVRIDVKVLGVHWLEILTQCQWMALPPERKPAEFYPYHEDCYIRMRPDLRD